MEWLETRNSSRLSFFNSFHGVKILCQGQEKMVSLFSERKKFAVSLSFGGSYRQAACDDCLFSIKYLLSVPNSNILLCDFLHNSLLKKERKNQIEGLKKNYNVEFIKENLCKTHKEKGKKSNIHIPKYC